MKILKLTIKKKWFDMILSGEKITEYRDLNPFWIKRLFDYKAIDATPESFLEALIAKKYPMFFYLKRFTHVQFFNGGYYSDKLPNFIAELDGISVREGIEEWGAEKGKDYLSIELGDIVSRSNNA